MTMLIVKDTCDEMLSGLYSPLDISILQSYGLWYEVCAKIVGTNRYEIDLKHDHETSRLPLDTK